MARSVKLRANRAATQVSGRKYARKAKHGLSLAAIGRGALKIGKAAFSIAKFVAAAGLVVATAAGAAALMPKHLRKQVVGDVRQIAAMTANEVSAQARALGARA